MNRPAAAHARSFLFLQGPHGPFFFQLARRLQRAGASVHRVGFNAGDRAFWPDRATYLPFDGLPEAWPARLDALLTRNAVSDIGLYGDTRPIHAEAIRQARARGIRIHVFEEGYLRPYWVTYEREGANGNSPLMQIPLDRIVDSQTLDSLEPPVPPGHWGDMRQHVFYGALYHWCVMCLNRRYRNFRPHRALNVRQEFALHLKRLLLMPFHALERRAATWRLRRGGFAYHLALLQLEHDSSFLMHGPFARQRDFLDSVMAGFAAGAPADHHLVFKAHPLDDGRAPLRRDIRVLARMHGIADRVHLLRGGKLAGVLDAARSAVTVNSTAGQQVLWRGIPLRVFGSSVYDRPELVSRQPLAEFFARPERPDRQIYRAFRDFLLATSQLPGSFYSARGRRQLVHRVTEMMLADADPYSLSRSESAADRQQLQVMRPQKRMEMLDFIENRSYACGNDAGKPAL